MQIFAGHATIGKVWCVSAQHVSQIEPKSSVSTIKASRLKAALRDAKHGAMLTEHRARGEWLCRSCGAMACFTIHKRTEDPIVKESSWRCRRCSRHPCLFYYIFSYTVEKKII